MARKGSNRKDVAVLVGDRGVRRFLDSFFADRASYRPSFFSKPDSFLKHIKRTPPDAVVADEPHLSAVADRITRFPVVAMIRGDIEAGIDSAINNNVKCYLYEPYFGQDLEHKLQSIILDQDHMKKMENDLRELETVVDVTRIISTTLDPKEMLFRIVRKVADLMPVTRCSIVRVDWLRRSAFVVASFEDPRISGLKLSLRKYPEIVEALTSKKPVIIADTTNDPIMKKVLKIIEPLGIKSILVIPIFFKDRVIGTLFLRTTRARHKFTPPEVKLLNAIANASSNALHNAFLFEQVEDEKTRLEKIAITDYLTGIYNVRYFYHRIIEEFSRSQRYGSPLGCIMLDIDHFKRINDVYGHKAGDEVLREFAQLLKKHTRQSDVLARYGGEEFIILLPQTPLEGAVAEAERIRLYVSQHRFKSLKKKEGITVSAGVAILPDPRITAHETLISFADNALYAAKQQGRDRVVVYGQ